MIGSALSDEVLQRAGVRRASAIVVSTSSDSDNVFVTLSARELNPRIRVHARAESRTVRRRLLSAGAERVVSAYRMGGMRMAASLLRPSVVDFLEISRPRHGEEVDLDEIQVASGSPLAGQSTGTLEANAERGHEGGRRRSLGGDRRAAMAELNLRTLRDFEHVDRELEWDY